MLRAPALRRTAVPATALLLLLSGCSEERRPTTITVTPGSLSLDAVGAQGSLAASVLDQDGQAMTGVTITWSSSTPTVATVSGTGVVTSVGNGTTTIRAEVGSASGAAQVTVQQVATQLGVEGDLVLDGTAGEPLAPLTIVLQDRLGRPAQGVPVTFQVTAGGGSFSQGSVNTAADGRASSVWTLGSVAGTTQEARASAAGGLAAPFQATARAGSPDRILKIAGDDQSFRRGGVLPLPLEIRVTDRFENPISGAGVTWSVASGGGAPGSGVGVTNAQGEASTTWTLGSALGTQTLTASVSGVDPATFTATATAVPASLAVTAGSGQTATVGTAVPVAPEVRVLDEDGVAIAQVPVTFRVLSGGGTVSGSGGSGNEAVIATDADGRARLTAWTLGTSAGEQSLTAQVTGLNPVPIIATAQAGPAAQLVKVSGDGQSGTGGSPLAAPIVVRVADQFGNPRNGVTVTFAPVSGSGSASPAVAVTAGNGTAFTEWTLGAASGTQELTVSAGPDVPPVSFFATAAAGGAFNIQLEFTTATSAPVQQAFANAAARWASVITTKLPPISNLQLDADDCGNPTATTVNVDDLLIFVTVTPIDGPGGVLGQAGPCFIRTASGLPIVGVIELDADDMAGLDASGQLEAVILHEMGHVLGIGSLWAHQGLLQLPSLPSSPGADTHFNGGAAIAAFDAIGGAGYAGGAKVPVENTQGGEGTRDAHWRLSVFGDELMVGFIGATSPMSRVTIGSLADLGYGVNLNAADAYTLTLPSPMADHEHRIHLGDDLLRLPLRVVNEGGEVVRVLPAPGGSR